MTQPARACGLRAVVPGLFCAQSLALLQNYSKRPKDQSAFDPAAQISLLGKLKLTNCALSTLRPAHAIGKIETSLDLPRPTHLCSQATDYSLTLSQSKPATVCPRRVLVAIRRWMLDGA